MEQKMINVIDKREEKEKRVGGGPVVADDKTI